MGIPGDGYTSLHGNSSTFTASISPPVQVQTPPSTAGHTSTRGETLYYGSPVQEYTPKDPEFPLQCYWSGDCEHGLTFPDIISLMNHLETVHINPQSRANANQS
ncbi:uncharacterized protein N7446_010798 [Penicillium canescens]|uniref:C2H2-type domain-containing protein n=1 Tax=Penicillium canescens TaxID=5083 RepID=A0AAD6N8B8_PENCN|nr:uncharacterized protein N7446_010798 [Penicillium canescens]KAJ6041311.1 hypothetical protein N7460_006701 [Penicillium canescens]KAJ6050689.1 hypothetical protein N7446_010798 [Penicillium canescens]KAJ6065909.1 hypothetical protein N7444_001562 [Penicillium canescens]